MSQYLALPIRNYDTQSNVPFIRGALSDEEFIKPKQNRRISRRIKKCVWSAQAIIMDNRIVLYCISSFHIGTRM